MQYDFFAPPRIVFGWGRRVEIGSLAKSLGTRAFIVSGSRTLDSNGILDDLCRNLQTAGVVVERLTMQTREPDVADVDFAVARLREIGTRDGDLIIAIGGGSAIDLAKAVAALATQAFDGTQARTASEGSGNYGAATVDPSLVRRPGVEHCSPSSVKDYLEGVGRGLKIERPPLPVLAVPTTAGTGTEATKNAVISSFDPPFKKSLRSDLMVPKAVLVDPELTVSLPQDITAYTGMDAITQLIESLISRRAKPIPRALCWHGLELALPAMFQLSSDLHCRSAREAMSHAALLSGMALANSGLGFAHGVAAALGVHAKVSHGLACAVMLPAALQINRDAAKSDLAQLGRLSSNWLSGEPDLPPLDFNCTSDTATQHFQAVIRTLNQRLGIPKRLSSLGVTRDQLPTLVKGSRGNSMDGNPRDVSDQELRELLERMF